jgi:hypothetical protein
MRYWIIIKIEFKVIIELLIFGKKFSYLVIVEILLPKSYNNILLIMNDYNFPRVKKYE